ncbi:MAG: hypothetical protein Q9M76_04455 [Candidatus Dojkabacteria bacterium]|nr:hypothetical protein [Candidatus Dojkabacteria bacterium]
MHLGAIEKRSGLAKFGDQASANAVMYIATARYASGQDLFRFEKSAIYRYNSGVWTDVTPAGETINAVAWTSANLYELFYCSPGNVFNTSTASGILKQSTLAGGFTAVNDSPGCKVLIGYAGRLFAMNTTDSAATNTPYRVKWTGVGVFDNWTDAALGAGEVDLSTSGYPIQAAVVTAGRLVILKGDATGGSIVMCSSTYDAAIPLVFEPMYGIGIVGRGSLVTAGADLHLFLGHDHFYAISSARVTPLEHPVAAEAVSRVNPDRYTESFSYYNPYSGDVRFVIPVGTSDMECYTFNVRTKTWAGPEKSTPTLVAATSYIVTDVSTWSTITGTWESHTGKSWASLSPSGGPARLVLGSSDSWVYEEDPGYYSDAGASIEVKIETGDYDFAGVDIVQYGSRYPSRIEAGDELAINGLYVEYVNAWTPVIEISADGGKSWTQVFSGTLSGSVDEHTTKLITFPEIVGTKFRVRITHTSATETFKLIGLYAQVDWRRRAFAD